MSPDDDRIQPACQATDWALRVKNIRRLIIKK
jgi:hypothetical protein